jgi:hypothetical protein
MILGPITMTPAQRLVFRLYKKQCKLMNLAATVAKNNAS